MPNRSQSVRKLSTWVTSQRAQLKRNALTEEQISLLDDVNFTWRQRDRESWEHRLAEVIAFKEKHGHCNIPLNLTEPPKLSKFVNATRVQRNKEILSAERIAKLDAVGSMWQGEDYKIGKNGMNEAWKVRYDELLEYMKTYGDCKVPQGRQRHEKYAQLGNWVQQQRSKKKSEKLHPERIRLLQEVGFI